MYRVSHSCLIPNPSLRVPSFSLPRIVYFSLCELKIRVEDPLIVVGEEKQSTTNVPCRDDQTVRTKTMGP